MPPSPRPSVTFSADDFGLSESVNAAVERAHRYGVLDAASLMVSAPAAGDAIARARSMPRLRVGLHLVVVEGQATLPHAAIPDLVDPTGWFGSDQIRRGIKYFIHPRLRRQLAAEIGAQYAAFAASGLKLDHANAHKHMHLHPIVGRLLIDIGQQYGLTRIRIPAEPPWIMAACGERPSLSSRALYHWTGILRAQARSAGLDTDDAVFGLTWTGHMTTDRLILLSKARPPGQSEIYFHPATQRDAALAVLMPDYDHTGELAALCDSHVANAYGRTRSD